MDTKIIKKYGEDILCYRLRTARQKKRMQYEDFDKYLIQLNKIENSLYKQRQNLGFELLLPPIQRGWNRFYVLRDDVAAGKHADFFRNILNKINTYDWSHRKDFLIKKRRYGRKKYVVKPQKLFEPGTQEFIKLDFTDREKLLFHEVIEIEKWSKKPVKRYVFNEPWRYRLKIAPNMITKVRIKDAILESKIATIENYMKRNDFRKRQRKILDGYSQYRFNYIKFEKYNETNRFKNKPIWRILEDLKEEM
jgi:hypothetical protein